MQGLELWQRINEEIDRQFALRDAGEFADTAFTCARNGKLDKLTSILAEEVGEYARAVNDNLPAREMRDELLQVAAIAVAAIRGLDAAMVAQASAI